MSRDKDTMVQSSRGQLSMLMSQLEAAQKAHADGILIINVILPTNVNVCLCVYVFKRVGVCGYYACPYSLVCFYVRANAYTCCVSNINAYKCMYIRIGCIFFLYELILF